MQLWLAETVVFTRRIVYGKDELDTLEPAQKKQLKRVVELIKAEWG
jgi:hypothetical protein